MNKHLSAVLLAPPYEIYIHFHLPFLQHCTQLALFKKFNIHFIHFFNYCENPHFQKCIICCLCQKFRKNFAKRGLKKKHNVYCVWGGRSFWCTFWRTHPSLLAFVLGGRPFKCEMCPKAFARSHQLAVHQPVHTGEKAHLCSECGNAFSSVSSLIDHRKRRHLELRDHKCTLCPKGKFFVIYIKLVKLF